MKIGLGTVTVHLSQIFHPNEYTNRHILKNRSISNSFHSSIVNSGITNVKTYVLGRINFKLIESFWAHILERRIGLCFFFSKFLYAQVDNSKSKL